MRAVRYTLIVASTEHEFSTGCCQVLNLDLPDAKKHRFATAALSGRPFFGHYERLAGWRPVRPRRRKNWGLRNTHQNRILVTPQCDLTQFAEYRC